MTTPAGKFVYATNFRFGTVEVFDSHFNLVKSFTDPGVPAGFAPFGIHNIGGNLFVTFEAPTSASPFFHRSLEVAGHGPTAPEADPAQLTSHRSSSYPTR